MNQQNQPMNNTLPMQPVQQPTHYSQKKCPFISSFNLMPTPKGNAYQAMVGNCMGPDCMFWARFDPQNQDAGECAINLQVQITAQNNQMFTQAAQVLVPLLPVLQQIAHDYMAGDDEAEEAPEDTVITETPVIISDVKNINRS